MDRRVALALGVVAAAALLGAALWSLVDEEPGGGKPESDGPAEAAPPAETPTSRIPAVSPPASRTEAPATVAAPMPTGHLECLAQAGEGVRRALVRYRVCLPSGEEVVSGSAETDSVCRLGRVPAGVPLVVRVEAPEALTGVCADVNVRAGGTLRKSITLQAAPEVRLRIPLGVAGFRADLLRGDRLVASAPVQRTVVLRPTELGSLRLRIVRGDEPPHWEMPLDVLDADEPFEREIELAPFRTVHFSVVTAAGLPASRVSVWSVSPSSPPRTAESDEFGIARLGPVPEDAKFLAVARGPDGTFASVVVDKASGSKPIPLVLGDAVALTGDVVDPGNRAIANARVEIDVRPLAEPVVVRSAESGLFESPPLPGGLASVTVTCDGYEPWRSETPVEIQPRLGARIRARLVPSPRGAVVVTVTDDAGAPVADADVVLHPSRLKTRTRGDGTCRVDGVPADTEQFVYARIRGYRGLADGSPSVRVVRDTAVHASVTLRRSTTSPPAAAEDSVPETTAIGRFLDAESQPVGGVRVESCGVATFSGSDGRFVLAGVRVPDDGAPADVAVTPGPGLFDPVRLSVHAEDAPRKDFGDVRLRRRPYALVDLPATPPRLAARKATKASKFGRADVFWLSTNQADVFLGARTAPFEPALCVSYDGAWLVLPPADAWRTSGRGEVFVAYDTGRGLATAAASWTLRPDEDDKLRPHFPTQPARLSGAVLAALKGARDAVLQQAECATLFDPRSEHVPTGNPQGPVDPFAALTAWRTFRVSRKDLDWDVAPGRWKIQGATSSVECLVPAWFDPRER